MLRSAKALLLFATVLTSYGWQWLLWRLSGRRMFGGRWEAVHQSNARRLAIGFASLRGVYIKLGQVVSVLGSFLPAAYAQQLEKLQDAVPPRPFSEIEPRLESAWGPEPLTRLSQFEKSPVASASLAQVYRGRTAAGQPIAIKVLYPGIERIVARDMKIIGLVIPAVERLFGFSQAPVVIAQLAQMLTHELDYERERHNLEKMRQLFADREDVVIPSVYQSLCSDKVLVMSFEEGCKLTSKAVLEEQGIDGEAVGNTLVECYLRMLLESRVFHADPHPGNLLAQPGNKLVLLDFGAVEDIAPPLVSGLKKVILGGLTRNADGVIAGLEEMGFVAEGGDRALLERVGREYLAKLAELNVTNFSKLDPKTLQEVSGFDQIRGKIREVAKSLRYPDGYFYVERTLALLFAVVGQVVPEKGLLGVAAPHASKALMKSFAQRPPKAPTAAAPLREHSAR